VTEHASHPHRPADDTEEVYFQGTPRLRGELGKLFLFLLIGFALIIGPAFMPDKLDVPPWVWMICFAAGFCLISFPFALARTTHYRVTNYRVDYEHGIFSKSIDTLELWHVEDIQLHQTLLERMLGVGTIRILSSDGTTPHLSISAIPHPRPLFDTLKQRIIAVKRQRGVIKIDG
jgi:hypothetical protein